MQERVTCNSGSSKPSKYEPAYTEYKWSLINKFPDSDKKRTTVCKNPKPKPN